MPCQYVEQYLKSDSRYVIVNPSITGELHPQATCNVYVFWLRNVVLKLSIESGLRVTYCEPAARDNSEMDGNVRAQLYLLQLCRLFDEGLNVLLDDTGQFLYFHRLVVKQGLLVCNCNETTVCTTSRQSISLKVRLFG